MTATDAQVRIIMREQEKGRTQEQAAAGAEGRVDRAFDSLLIVVHYSESERGWINHRRQISLKESTT